MWIGRKSILVSGAQYLMDIARAYQIWGIAEICEQFLEDEKLSQSSRKKALPSESKPAIVDEGPR